MEWYREQTIQLIDLFRARPALWDASSVHYRNKRMKNEALEQISGKLRCPKEEIAKKICTLRVQFSRENVKVKRAREAGAVYNPKWFGYELLCFLNDQSRFNGGYHSSAGTSAHNVSKTKTKQKTAKTCIFAVPSRNIVHKTTPRVWMRENRTVPIYPSNRRCRLVHAIPCARHTT